MPYFYLKWVRTARFRGGDPAEEGGEVRATGRLDVQPARLELPAAAHASWAVGLSVLVRA
jgi:hypothetical protein